MSLKQLKILIIAGSDPCGGAGIQADIKTATTLKTYSSSIITSLTAQNTQKVSAIFNPPISFLKKQLEAIFDDIKFDAIKIGMLANSQIINLIADFLEKNAKKIPIILDPVMVATSGDSLLEKSAIELLKSRLIKQSHLITPNIDEAEILANMKIKNLEDMKLAAKKIKKLGAKNILIKGGHLKLPKDKIINLFLSEHDDFYLISNKRLKIKNIHGTGCTLSSAITCYICKENSTLQAIKKANNYTFKAIEKNLKIGKGSLVLQHY